MRNLVLHLAFDGARYHGWQVQGNAPTVQRAFQDAVETVFGSRLPVTGCSRTDAGVHATDYVCTVKAESAIPCKNILRALNANLPSDIAVLSCAEAPEDFHPRYTAHGKEYLYQIWNAPVRSPFLRGRAYFYPYPLDISALSAAAACLTGRHDFASFCAAGSDTGARPPEDGREPESATVRTIFAADVTREGGMVRLLVSGDGFLYHMVRIIAGTLLLAARTPGYDVRTVLASRRRELAGPTAPACGLYLSRVFYPGMREQGMEANSRASDRGKGCPDL